MFVFQPPTVMYTGYNSKVQYIAKATVYTEGLYLTKC